MWTMSYKLGYRTFLWALIFHLYASVHLLYGEPASWKAGFARVEITPSESLWMAGYAARDGAARGTMHALWAKAFAFEDAEGRIGLLVSTDLLGFPEEVSDNIRTAIQKKYDIPYANIMLNSSHTHSGPVLKNALYDIYPLTKDEKDKIEKYSGELEKLILEVVEKAMSRNFTARMYSGSGIVRFAVNRRENQAEDLNYGNNIRGPFDHTVPVLTVKDAGGVVRGILFGYACHATTIPPNSTEGYLWSGDYPGFAQTALEESYPEAAVLFVNGTSGDQGPIAQGKDALLAKQYGVEIASAVERVLENPMTELEPAFSSAYSEVDLQLNSPPTDQELQNLISEGTNYQQRWARRMIAERAQSKDFRSTYPYPVQMWRIGQQNIVSLGGEVVVDYGIRFKQIFGPDTFVFSYSNDVMGYIPSARIIREGGYEGAYSQCVYGLPSTWKTNIENTIISAVVELADSIGIAPEQTTIRSR